jgi:hypothetical protein
MLSFGKSLLFAAAVMTLAACGDVNANLERAKQEASDLGQQAVDMGADVLDTRSACVLAGQSASFCGCLAKEIGPDITSENVQALTEMVRATVSGGDVNKAAEGAGGVDAQSQAAILECATRAAVEDTISEGGN